jgi:23S rRNA (uracil1939-C5)-methyltransferase
MHTPHTLPGNIMETVTLDLTDMAHGGAAIGRDEQQRVIFVPLALPGERVRVEIVEDKGRYAHGRLVEILTPAPDRVEPRCPHFGPCGGCHFQHISYPRQLELKGHIVRDQLARIGRFADPPVAPVLANPEPWDYSVELTLNPAPEGGMGYWSPALGAVMPIETCHLVRPSLRDLLQDVDLELPGLRKIQLRVGDDEALLMAIAVDGVEPPELAADFPVSAAIILPDDTAVNLIGDNFTIQSVKGRDFQVTAGCFFYPSPAATSLLVDTLLQFARLTGQETVVELFSGVGMLTAFLAPAAGQVIGVELNPDAVADAAVNLEDTENVSLFEGAAEEALPTISAAIDLLVVDPPLSGLSRELMGLIAERQPPRLIYVSGDVATLARDGRQLAANGYRLTAVQPIDMTPHTYQILTVSLWER